MTAPGPHTTNVGPTAVDRNQYSDAFSSCGRVQAVGAQPVQLGQTAFAGGRAPRTARFNEKLRFRVDSALALGGAVTAAIYQGSDPFNLTKTVADFSITAEFGSAGLKQVAIPSTDALEAQYIYLAWVRTGPALLNPALSAAGNSGIADMLNATTAACPVSGTKSGTTLPATLNLYTGWNYLGTLPWFSLAV
jgi:hypothetical protein